MFTAALAAGAAAGTTDAAAAAVRDAYNALLAAVRRRFGRESNATEPGTAELLDAYEADPDGSRDRLVAALTAAGAGQDDELVAAARWVVVLAGQAAAGGSPVDLRRSKGVQVGNGNVQINRF